MVSLSVLARLPRFCFAIVGLVAAGLATLPAPARAEFPKPQGRVNDFARGEFQAGEVTQQLAEQARSLYHDAVPLLGMTKSGASHAPILPASSGSAFFRELFWTRVVITTTKGLGAGSFCAWRGRKFLWAIALRSRHIAGEARGVV